MSVSNIAELRLGETQMGVKTAIMVGACLVAFST